MVAGLTHLKFDERLYARGIQGLCRRFSRVSGVADTYISRGFIMDFSYLNKVEQRESR